MTKKVAIIFGGYSPEWIISEKSAQVVFKHLDRKAYEPFLVKISKDGWTALTEKGQRIPIDRNDFSFKDEGMIIRFDAIFNAIHGTPGEDGLMAGYFYMLDLPYTSCGVLASSITFSKSYCNGFLRQYADVNIADSVVISKGDDVDVASVIDQVGLPCFVKPNNAGSSFGISKVKETGELLSAIEKAFEHDHQAVVEQFISGTEVSNGVYEADGVPAVLSLTEIVSANEFFDFNAKYEGSSQEITPARVDTHTMELVRETTSKVYTRLGLSGMARIDYIIRNGVPFLIEVNTIPGLSEESILPQQVRLAGMTLREFFGTLIEEARCE